MMNVPFAVAALLAFVAAVIHGGVGEKLVVMRLRTDVLEPTRFGGPTMTKLMIRVTWHVATLAFAVTGSAMAACVPAGSGAACAGVGRVSAAAYASFAVLAIGLGIALRGRRAWKLFVRHPGPVAFVAVAVLAWRGS